MRIDMLQVSHPSERPADPERGQDASLSSLLQETRALMNRHLGNPLLFDMGLKTACEALADRLMERHPVRIICDIREAFMELNPDVKTILYQSDPEAAE